VVLKTSGAAGVPKTWKNKGERGSFTDFFSQILTSQPCLADGLPILPKWRRLANEAFPGFVVYNLNAHDNLAA